MSEVVKENHERLLKFIDEHKDLVQENNFKELYYLFAEEVTRKLSVLTSLFLESNINFMEYLDKIPTHCFRYSDIKNIEIPNNILEIEEAAFVGCRKLVSIDIPSSVTDIGDFAFANCTNLESIILPNSIKHIGRYAFHDCPKLTNITIPESVKYMSYSIFYGCTNLKKIVFENTEQKILKIVDVDTIKDLRNFLEVNNECEIIFKG